MSAQPLDALPEIHDFDFIHGHWSITNRHLKACGVGSDDWDQFPSTSWCEPRLGGLANVEQIECPARGWTGMAVRSFDIRAREWAILRSLGATQDLLARVQRIELLGVGALAGALSAAAALAIGAVLAAKVFDFAWQAPLWWPLLGAVSGALLAWLAGWWSLRGVVQRPVALTLRQAE